MTINGRMFTKPCSINFTRDFLTRTCLYCLQNSQLRVKMALAYSTQCAKSAASARCTGLPYSCHFSNTCSLAAGPSLRSHRIALQLVKLYLVAQPGHEEDLFFGHQMRHRTEQKEQKPTPTSSSVLFSRAGLVLTSVILRRLVYNCFIPDSERVVSLLR